MNRSVPINHQKFAAANLSVGRRGLHSSYQMGYIDEGLPTSCLIAFPACAISAVKERKNGAKLTFTIDRESVIETLRALEGRVITILHEDSEHYLTKKRSREYVAKRYRSFLTGNKFSVEIPTDSNLEYDCVVFDIGDRPLDIPAGSFAEHIKPGTSVRPIIKFYEVYVGENKIEIHAGLFQMKLCATAFSDTRTDDEVAQRTMKISHQKEHEELEKIAAKITEEKNKAGGNKANVKKAKKPIKIEYNETYDEYSDSDSDVSDSGL